MMALPNSQDIYEPDTAGGFWVAASVLRGSVDRTTAMLPDQKLHNSTLFTFLVCVLVLVAGWFTTRSFKNRSAKTRKNYPPGVPGGLPVIGNLLQLKSLKPHRTITDLSEKFGPIFQLNLGPLKYVFVTSPELAREAGVIKFESVSKRSMMRNMYIWTYNQNMVATIAYGEDYRKLKKLLTSQVLAAAPHKSLCAIREQILKTVVDGALEKLGGSPGLVNVRRCVQHYIFPFVMHQSLGYVPESLYVPELGNLELWDIFNHLVSNVMKSIIIVDWRDFLPFLSWVPNPAFEKKVVEVAKRRNAVIRALIEQKRRQLESQSPVGGFVEHMLTAATDLSSFEIELLTWEPIIEGTDTSLVTTEWAMYELAKHQDVQERLYQEIQLKVGSRRVTESDLNLPLLDAVFKETLRLHAPVVLLPPREVEEDVTLGGYNIPKGWQVVINVYGINTDKKRWAKADEWIPDRFLDAPQRDLGLTDFELIPFGLGKRRCAGVVQATTIVTSFVASFVQSFHLSLQQQDLSLVENSGYFTTQMINPLEVLATPRTSQSQQA